LKTHVHAALMKMHTLDLSSFESSTACHFDGFIEGILSFQRAARHAMHGRIHRNVHDIQRFSSFLLVN
jgi:hypothetical protein